MPEVDEYTTSIEYKMEGSIITKAEISGSHIELHLSNGYVFYYEATDGGYSTYELEKENDTD